MTSEQKLALISYTLAAVRKPAVPNGTTKKMRRLLEDKIDRLFDEITTAVNTPTVPNGTTLKIRGLLDAA